MNQGLYCSIVSLACFLYARYLIHQPSENLTEEQFKERMDDITFYSLFGATALLMSYL